MAMNRREFLRRAAFGASGALLCGPLVGGALAMGEASLFRPGILRYEGHWDGRPTFAGTLLSELEARTSVRVGSGPVTVSPTEVQMFELPFLWMTGDRPVEPFPPAAVENLSRHLRFGGTLFVDDTSGREDSQFAASLQREFQRIFPTRELEPLPEDHALYRSYYHLRRPAGRVNVANHQEGITIDDRAAVILCRNDLSGALERGGTGGWQYPLESPAMDGRELSVRLGVNLLIYALTVNYKLDQVHVSYQLRNPGRYPAALPSEDSGHR